MTPRDSNSYYKEAVDPHRPVRAEVVTRDIAELAGLQMPVIYLEPSGDGRLEARRTDEKQGVPR